MPETSNLNDLTGLTGRVKAILTVTGGQAFYGTTGYEALIMNPDKNPFSVISVRIDPVTRQTETSTAQVGDWSLGHDFPAPGTTRKADPVREFLLNLAITFNQEHGSDWGSDVLGDLTAVMETYGIDTKAGLDHGDE